LGLGLINGKGDTLKFGGQVMKNVAGYDVSRAMVGSLGCMGLITELSLKVLPVATQQFFVQKPCGLQEAIELAAKLDEGMTMRNGFAWFDGVAHIRFAGPEEAVSEVFKGFALEAYACKSEVIWDELSKMSYGIFSGDESLKLWRIVTPKYTDLSGLFDGKPLLMNWAGGEYFVRSSDEEMQRIKDKLGVLGAHAYSYHPDQTYVLQGLSPTVERLHSALKQAFDPHGVFNLGRMSEAF
jgi:glycolate oxidase FAD binding subunit